MHQHLALFDFDGTITRKDTFIVFIQYHVGKLRYALGVLVLLPILVLYKLKLIKNWRAKEIMFGYFFRGMPVEKYNALGKAFADNVIPSLVRPSALKAIKDHIAAGDRVVLVTASSAAWIKGWSDSLGMEIISTEWEQKDGRITGKIEGINCHGIEKRNRIMKQIELGKYEQISVYGDTSGDREMLELGTHKFYRHFKD